MEEYGVKLKLLPLQRDDSLLAFSGNTAFASPVLLQLDKSISNDRKSLAREQDIRELRSHLLNEKHVCTIS